MITRLTFDQISTAVHDAYEACKDIKGGQNAHYIPYLANVNSDLFGISLCLPDGRLISVGDTDYRFGIESVSKVHTAILALEQHGAQAILDDIGADATGLPFNSIFAILLPPKYLPKYYQIQQYAFPVFMIAIVVLPYVFNFNPFSWYLGVTAGNLFDFMFPPFFS
jgi:hypothetical protein